MNPQPHSELREMLSNISPLPWHTPGEVFNPMEKGHKAACYSAIGIGNGASHIGYASVTPACHEQEAKANADYLVHCANLFPKLLAAAEAFVAEVHANVPGAASASSEVWNAMSDAIAEAHGQMNLKEE